MKKTIYLMAGPRPGTTQIAYHRPAGLSIPVRVRVRHALATLRPHKDPDEGFYDVSIFEARGLLVERRGAFAEFLTVAIGAAAIVSMMDVAAYALGLVSQSIFF